MRAPLLLVAGSLLGSLLAGCTNPLAPVDPSGILPLDDLPLPEVTGVVQVDTRWSGEPSILALADGTLLITGAGGMTRYAENPLDAPGNFGQSYLWRSTDGGATWQFVDLGLPAPLGGLLPYRNAIAGVEGDLAEDDEGRAYFVDLTMLALNGLAASADSGATWTATQNPAVGLPLSDRPWVAAFGDGQVYVKYLHLATGQRVARSADGGMTFLEDVAIDCGSADIVEDRDAKEVLVPCVGGGQVYLLRSGEGPMAWERLDVAAVGGDAGAAAADFPALGVAGTGRYVVVWRESEEVGTRIKVATSVDRGATWSAPLALGEPGHTRVFPWVDANAAGDVGVVWYGTTTGGNPNEVDAEWFPLHATLRLGADGALDVVNLTRLVDEPVHVGSICTDGLGCVLEGRAEDRRLLDFFEIDVDEAGVHHVTWTNTQTDVPTVWYGAVRGAPPG